MSMFTLDQAIVTATGLDGTCLEFEMIDDPWGQHDEVISFIKVLRKNGYRDIRIAPKKHDS